MEKPETTNDTIQRLMDDLRQKTSNGWKVQDVNQTAYDRPRRDETHFMSKHNRRDNS